MNNIENDFYARDTSKKIRAVKRAKGQAGEHLGEPPYGYKKDLSDKKKWSVDEATAEVVKRIFALCVAGKGPMQIAKVLTKEKVLTAKAYYAKISEKALPESPGQWHSNSVVGILERMEYCGHTVAFKTYSKSNKLKKRLETPKEVDTYEQDKADCCSRSRQEQRKACAESRYCLELYRYGGFPKRAARQRGKGKDGIALLRGLYRLSRITSL